MNNKFLAMFFLSFLLIGFVSASCPDTNYLGTFKQGEPIQLRQTCDSCTYVNISQITYPNSTSEYLNAEMTKQGTEYNYTFTSTNVTGRNYQYVVNGDKDGGFKSETFCFDITNSGNTTGSSDSSIYLIGIIFFFLLAILLFIAFLKHETKFQLKFTYLLGSYLFFISSLNIISIIIRDTFINSNLINFFDSFTGIAFLLFWFAFGLVAIMWGLTFFQTLMINNTKKNLEKYGY